MHSFSTPWCIGNEWFKWSWTKLTKTAKIVVVTMNHNSVDRLTYNLKQIKKIEKYYKKKQLFGGVLYKKVLLKVSKNSK